MSAPVRLGVVLLCHSNLALAARLVRLWTEGGARVAIHVDARAPEAELAQMRAALADRQDSILFSRRRPCRWGHFSLVAATQDAATELLAAWPDCTHVYLASGSCLPLRPVADLVAFLAADPRRDHIESVNARDTGWVVGGLNEERFTLYFPFDWRRQRRLFDGCTALQRRWRIRRELPAGLTPHLGSQWWCLTATTLRAILDDPRRAEFDRFFRLGWIPDESYFQTLARRHSARIESRSLTFAHFDHQGRPYYFHDDHARLLEDSRCFVARKIWSGATGLLSRFPRPVASAPDPSPPEPALIDRMIDATARRRSRGRPGLYMQSRFPRKDAENGKTSSPYVVFQGLDDIFPDFRPWLARHLPGEVHGHLLATEGAEFAGGALIGPGGLTRNAALRDHDPRGFLAALIRMSPQRQIFQFSPRDNQALNWFMATDPNARLIIVRSSWLMPLAVSGMPFDDIRRIAARLQWAEAQQVEALQSVWLRARVQIWELGAFLTDPQRILDQTLREIDPAALPVTGLPAMRDMTALPGLIRRLRNSGLRPRLGADLLPALQKETVIR